MPRNDGNKDKNEELTPHQIKDVKAHLASKKKYLEETDGTIK